MKIKVGDRVKRVRGRFKQMVAGDIDIVVAVVPDDIQLKKTTDSYELGRNTSAHDVSNFVKVNFSLENK